MKTSSTTNQTYLEISKVYLDKLIDTRLILYEMSLPIPTELLDRIQKVRDNIEKIEKLIKADRAKLND